MRARFEELCDEEGVPVVTVCTLTNKEHKAVGISIRSLDDKHSSLGRGLARRRAERAIKGRPGCEIKMPEVYNNIAMMGCASLMEFLHLMDGVIKGHKKGWLMS